ncbi:MAG: TIGR01777 family protein [Acidobacteria bacterium]|nr:MAG: TIGR01777 family protein [Acidobacteriota bacterium]
MKCGITGMSGLIGSALARSLRADGHQPIGLPRSVTDPALLDRLDAVVNLAGAPIAGQRWTAARKSEIRESRVRATRDLVQTLGRSSTPPTALISGSAIGFYGVRGDEELDENSPRGTGFLPEVAEVWEKEAQAAAKLGVRVVLVRTGIVLAREGGALPEMAKPFRAFAGGPIGEGTQWMSWIHLVDEVRVIRLALDFSALDGPINSTAPNPVRNEEFAHELGKALKRPSLIKAPAFALRAVFGEMANELLLGGQRVLPRRLLQAGFQFQFPNLGLALADVFG